MKCIKATKDQVVLVDDDDFELLSSYKWFVSKRRKGYVAATSIGSKTIYMHRLLTKCPDGLMVDHINHNTLDNRKLNLRVCTNAQNVANMVRSTKNECSFKGVYLEKSGKRKKPFRAEICKNGVKYRIGSFETAIEAARAYNAKALEIHGEFASINADVV